MRRKEPILPLLLTVPGQFLHVLVGLGSGTDSPARSPRPSLYPVAVSLLLQAEEKRTAEKRRADSDRGPESEHGRKVSGAPCPCRGTLVFEEETSRMCLPTGQSGLSPREAAACSDVVPTLHPSRHPASLMLQKQSSAGGGDRDLHTLVWLLKPLAQQGSGCHGGKCGFLPQTICRWVGRLRLYQLQLLAAEAGWDGGELKPRLSH